VRRALVSVAIAFAGVAGVIASGWALQAAALPPPKAAARIAADASVWFHDYRLAVDVFHFDHHRIEGACIRGWLRHRNGGQTHESLLSFEAGPILRVSGRRHVSVVVARRRRRFPPGLLAADVGCSRMLARTLAAAAQGAAHLSTERAYAANRPAVALELQRGREERLTLFVSPRTERPLVAFVDLEGQTITARIYLQRVRRGMLAQFRLLHRIKPEPRR
jgi:hypothetical protein